MVVEQHKVFGVSLPPGEEELPYDDGEPMESHEHRVELELLAETATEHVGEDGFVAGNMAVYYSETQAAKNEFRAPDFFVVLGAGIRARKSWVVWAEGGKTPDVVIELLSESTKDVDRGVKKRIYERILKVYEYFLFDLATNELEGYRLTSANYEPIPADADGRLTCEGLGLRLGLWHGKRARIERTWLRWFYPDRTLVPTDFERAQAEAERAQAEAERAQAEAERAQAEAERADDLATRLARYEAAFGPLDEA